MSLAVVALGLIASRPALAEFTFEVVKSFERPARPYSGLVQGSDGAFYGRSMSDSWPPEGEIFKIDRAGNFTRLHAFRDPAANSPSALVLGSDGAIYGTASSNYTSWYGMVFKIDTAGVFTSLYSGINAGELVPGSDGALYAVGSWSNCWCAAIFKIDTAGLFTVLRSFGAGDGGETPSHQLVLGSDGALYGTTRGGSTPGTTIFKIDSTGTFKRLYSFGRNDYHANDLSYLLKGSDGAIYGNELTRSSNDAGIFRIDSAGAFTSVHTSSYSEGEILSTGLTRGSDGALYGTINNYLTHTTTIFKIDGQGNFVPLHTFSAWGVYTPLVQGHDGALYGSTADISGLKWVFRIDSAGEFSVSSWDAYNQQTNTLESDGALYGITVTGDPPVRTFFKIDSAGEFTPLHSFYSPDGYNPQIAMWSNGALYGKTTRGGASDAGTIFRIDGAGTFSSLHSFTHQKYGQKPTASLLPGSDGALYGTTSAGDSSDAGTVFKIDSAGTYSLLHEFSGGDGDSPVGPLVQTSDGALLGTTERGGPTNSGTIFKIGGGGEFTSLHAFDYHSEGVRPRGLVPGNGDVFFGTTTRSTADACGGTAFRIDGSGAFVPLYRWVFGWNAYGGCGWDPPIQAQGSDGALYGIDVSHEGYADYRVFKINSAGNFSVLRSFFGTSVLQLVLARGGALYGSTYGDYGDLFKIDAAGTFTTLHSFDRYYDGISPGLALGSDGEVFGTFQSAYSETPGTLFEIDAAGTLTSLHSFRHEDGADPSPALVRGSDCALYGTAERGGPLDGGVVFRLYEAGHLCQQLDFEPLPDRTLGDEAFTVSATSSSALPVSFTAKGSCTTAGDLVTLTGGGLCTLTASQAGDADYEPAPEVAQSFHVLFDFGGFLSPVENPPALNRATGGRVVPMRFDLGFDAGRDVLADRSPMVQEIDCDTLAPLGEPERAHHATRRSLVHRRGTGEYAYIWKTAKHWAGTCRELSLELVDGSAHTAYFQFPERRRR